MPPERRAVLLLLGLALAGQGIRVWWNRPDTAPGGLVLLPPDSSQALAAQRQRSISLDRPLAAGEKIDLDKASVDDIARLPRVGRTLAKTIKADRDVRGPFGSLQGLDRVPGVGPGLLAVLSPHVVFSGRPTDRTLACLTERPSTSTRPTPPPSSVSPESGRTWPVGSSPIATGTGRLAAWTICSRWEESDPRPWRRCENPWQSSRNSASRQEFSGAAHDLTPPPPYLA